jgi:hypothetical protein
MGIKIGFSIATGIMLCAINNRLGLWRNKSGLIYEGEGRVILSIKDDYSTLFRWVAVNR